MNESGPWDELPNYVLALLAVGVVIALLIFRRADFVINVRGRRVYCKGKCPVSEAALAEFFGNDLALTGPVTVRGVRRNGRLQLSFRGRLTNGDKQRIRNYLLASL
jgi:hypothetical protein